MSSSNGQGQPAKAGLYENQKTILYRICHAEPDDARNGVYVFNGSNNMGGTVGDSRAMKKGRDKRKDPSDPRELRTGLEVYKDFFDRLLDQKIIAADERSGIYPKGDPGSQHCEFEFRFTAEQMSAMRSYCETLEFRSGKGDGQASLWRQNLARAETETGYMRDVIDQRERANRQKYGRSRFGSATEDN